MSHKLLNKGRVKIFLNAVSDKGGETVYPYLESNKKHMLETAYVVHKEDLDSGKYLWSTVIGPPVTTVTVREILEQVETRTVILKIDLQGDECKVLSN